MNRTAKIHRQLDRLYARLPRVACKRKCQECCGPIVMSAAEWARIVERLGYAPTVLAGGICPMLDRDEGKCTVHDIRPMICRLWGAADGMRCEHGCLKGRPLSRSEAHRFLEQCEKINSKMRRIPDGHNQGQLLRQG